MLAVLVPALITLALWFVAAPEPRFVYGPIWLVPVALAAWALPAAPREQRMQLMLVALLAACGLAAIGLYDLALFLPAAVAVWVTAGLGTRRFGSERARTWIAHIAVGSVLLAAVAISVNGGRAYRPVPGDGPGPLGTTPLPETEVAPFVTSSGLQIWRPVPIPDEDRCWGLLLCTGYPNEALRLRGDDLADGFTVRAP
jgi:hypothetical protein